MRIGIDVRSLLEGSRGGVGEYTYQLLKRFTRSRTHRYVLFFNSLRTRSFQLREFREKGVEIISLRIPNKILNLALMASVGPSIDTLLGGVDVLWAPNIQFFSFSSRCRFVITCHDLSFERYPQFLSLKRRLWHTCVQPKHLYEQSDAVIAVSESTASDLRELYHIPSKKIHVVHSGVEKVEVFPEDFLRVKNHYDLPSSFILTLGTLEPRKNFTSVLSAFDFLVDRYHIEEDLVIVGMKGWNYDGILQVWRNMKYWKRVHFLGYVPERDKAVMYTLSKVFVWPSFYEGFGFPPLEAMASGTPVVAAHHSSFPEVVGEASLMVDPYNISDIAYATVSLLQDEELRREMIERGKQVVEKFSWDTTSKRMEELFEEVGR